MLQEFKHQTHHYKYLEFPSITTCCFSLLDHYHHHHSSPSPSNSSKLAMFPFDHHHHQDLITSSSSSSSASAAIARFQDLASALNPMLHASVPSLDHHDENPQKLKKKRNLPGNPDPDAEVIALSPRTLLATNRFVCEICNKGFQRDQNLQLHRRGHNLPWKLKQRSNKDQNRKRVYVCPEPTCVHHHPSRALGDLTGIKKHFCRKHGEKKWKCDKCSKFYAVQSDWKAHSKTCGTREYRCDCGTLFSRKDSFITHRAFCDALAEESARLSANSILLMNSNSNPPSYTPQIHLNPPPPSLFPSSTAIQNHQPPITANAISPWDPPSLPMIKTEAAAVAIPYFQEPQSMLPSGGTSLLSATALLQKAASIGATVGHVSSTMAHMENNNNNGQLGFATWQKGDPLTRDFLGLTADRHGGVEDLFRGNNDNNNNMYSDERGNLVNSPSSILKHHQLGFGFAAASETWGNC